MPKFLHILDAGPLLCLQILQARAVQYFQQIGGLLMIICIPKSYEFPLALQHQSAPPALFCFPAVGLSCQFGHLTRASAGMQNLQPTSVSISTTTSVSSAQIHLKNTLPPSQPPKLPWVIDRHPESYKAASDIPCDDTENCARRTEPPGMCRYKTLGCRNTTA